MILATNKRLNELGISPVAKISIKARGVRVPLLMTDGQFLKCVSKLGPIIDPDIRKMRPRLEKLAERMAEFEKMQIREGEFPSIEVRCFSNSKSKLFKAVDNVNKLRGYSRKEHLKKRAKATRLLYEADSGFRKYSKEETAHREGHVLASAYVFYLYDNSFPVPVKTIPPQ